MRGPVGMAMNIDDEHWNFYSRGIYENEECTPDINHEVIAVGYGIEKSKDETQPNREYVIIKNTWGKDWGEKGYMRISLSQKKYRQGFCGILSRMYGVDV